MRLLLSSGFLIVALCLPSLALAIDPAWCGMQCAGSQCVCVGIVGQSSCTPMCIDYCRTCNGVYLAPKQSFWSATASAYTIEFQTNPSREFMAGALHEATGWSVSTPTFGGVSSYPKGPFSGTVAEIAQQIAAGSGTGVTVDEANHSIVFGLPE